MEKASAKAADHAIKVTELTSTTKELRTKVAAAHSKEKEAATKINNLIPAQTSSASNPHDSTEVAKKVGSKMEGCTSVGDNAVNTTGFSIINKHNLAVMGKDIDSRTCVLRGVVKFTSDGNSATAWLDPNYRDPATEMPLCFPVSGTMQFFASIVNPKDTSEIERTVGLQIEPHGRWIRIYRYLICSHHDCEWSALQVGVNWKTVVGCDGEARQHPLPPPDEVQRCSGDLCAVLLPYGCSWRNRCRYIR